MKKKVALVTDVLIFAGPGIVTALLQDGYEVMAQSPSFTDDNLCEEYKKQYPGATPIGINDPAQLIEHVWDKCGTVDVLVSSDSYPAICRPIEEADDLPANLERLVVYPFNLMRAAAPKLKEQGHGKVIFVQSCRTDLPVPGGHVPDIARAGSNALAVSFSIEMAPYGIPVNAIVMNFYASEAYFQRSRFVDNPIGSEFIKGHVPAGRLGTPEELGELVCVLANMKGSYHTGAFIKFAGGWPIAPKWPV